MEERAGIVCSPLVNIIIPREIHSLPVGFDPRGTITYKPTRKIPLEDRSVGLTRLIGLEMLKGATLVVERVRMDASYSPVALQPDHLRSSSF